MPQMQTLSHYCIYAAWTACCVFGLFAKRAEGAALAYWRFEEGSAGSVVTKPFGASDSSGNGNHLEPGTAGGQQGFRYVTETAYNPVCQTSAVNAYGIKNTGSAPSLQTRSKTTTQGTGSNPTGTDIEAITPLQFTIEVFFKPENGGYRTLVGRDARNVTSTDSNLAALYLQICPDQSAAIVFVDVSGYVHRAASPAEMIQGFDWSTDPDGKTGRWYYMAAVNDGSTLKLYLADISAGTDPFLVAQTDMNLSGSPNRALTRGTISGSDWHTGAWSVGRGMYNGVRTDRAYGFIDEVRISDTALPVSQFLMMPKPTRDNNPIMDAADPHILLVDNKAWIYPTSGHYRRFYAYSSSNLVNWQSYSAILNFDLIPWIPAGKHAWAPAMVRKNGRYYFYYSVGPKPSHIGVATGLSPIGPFTDKGSALLSDNNAADFEAIDPMVFTDPASGISYLYAGGSAGSRLRVFELNSDMMSFTREITVANPPYFTEGAFMHYRKGVYYLSYSHGSWNNDTYSVHYCTSSTPVGPWTYRGRILSTEGWFKGPGHHSFVYNAALDEWYVVYHRWNERLDNGPYSGSRSVAIEKISYEGDAIRTIMQTDTGAGPVWLGGHLRSDFDQNNEVGLSDLLTLADAWLTDNTTGDMTPVGGDGFVGLQDMNFFAAQWLKVL
ncbi:MAG: family 43 glycosylhydrolase [Sedimentisphaerales bacterium]|nr:family 43 glycosylhydrolase [Sedimentisphaerales bacterium]